MDGYVKTDSTAVSLKGRSSTGSSGNFYLNGRYRYDYETDSIQVSMEQSSDHHFFAIYGGLEQYGKEPAVSMPEEFDRFRNLLGEGSRSIENRLDHLKDSIKGIDSLLYSSAVAAQGDKSGEISFAGLMMAEGKAAVVIKGGCKAYLFRSGMLKSMVADNTKTDRLVKLGIITQEQAKAISAHLNIGYSGKDDDVLSSEAIRIKKGDIFVLCSENLVYNIDDERIQDILLGDDDTGCVANMLVKEALKKKEDIDVTVLAVRIDGIPETSGDVDEEEDEDEEEADREVKPVFRPRRPARTAAVITESRKESFKTYAAVVITCLILAAIVYAAYRVWFDYYRKPPGESDGKPTTQQTSTDSYSDRNSSSPSTHKNTASGNAVQTSGKNSSTSGNVSGDTSGSTSGGASNGASGNNSGNASGNTSGSNSNSASGSNSVPFKYVVKSGDTLSSICTKHYGNISKINQVMKANNLSNANYLRVGQELVLP